MAINDEKPRTGLQATLGKLTRPMYPNAAPAQQVYQGVGASGLARTAAHQAGRGAAAARSGIGAVGDALGRGADNWQAAGRTDPNRPGPFSANNPGNAAFRRTLSGIGDSFSAGAAGRPMPPAPSAPTTTSRAPLLPGLVRATGDAIRGVQATNLMRPNLAAGIPTAASGAAPQPAARAPVMIDRVLPDGSFASQQRATPPQGPRPGDMNTFTGRDGQTRRVDVRATPADAATPYGVPSLSRPQPSQAASQYGIPSLARPQPGQGSPALNLTRPTPNPAGQRAAILDPRSQASEMVRRANAAMQSARVRSPAANTRSQMQRHYDAAGAERDFWLNQAGSLGSDAQARFLAGQQLRSQEGQTAASLGTQQNIADGRNATDLQRGFADNAARMQVAEMQQQGAMDRLNLDLSRPQPPITLADGTLAQLGPDGTLQPYTMPDGSAARGLQRPQRDYGAEAETRLMGQLISAQRNPETGLLAPNAGQVAREQLQQFRNGGVPTAAITALRGNPNLAADFDAKYGQGMAARYLASN